MMSKYSFLFLGLLSNFLFFGCSSSPCYTMKSGMVVCDERYTDKEEKKKKPEEKKVGRKEIPSKSILY